MSSTLPERPSLEQYKKLAKDLLAAAASGQPEALSFIREHHADALSKTKLGLSDAQHALARSLQFLSWPKLRAAILAQENEAFFAAVYAGEYEAVEKWLQARPELANLVNANGATAFHVAAERGHEAFIPLLVRHGANPEAKFGYSAHTPLSWAVTVGSFGFAEAMLKAGAKTDLFTAAGIGNLDAVKAFWVEGVVQPNPSQTGSSRFAADGSRLPRPPESVQDQVSDALYMASRHGRVQVIQWLLAHGADPNFPAYLGGTSLHWAEFSGSRPSCELLRAAGASDDLRDSLYGATPRSFGVVVPAGWGLLGILKRNLEQDPTLANASDAKWTPLQAAAKEGQSDSVRLLLAYGADPSVRDADGQTALDIARSKEHGEIVKLLDQ